ncbi:MAG: EscN/YscN/HrcN family type III secretion system ATPase, partial [Phycisphaerales bacterium]|nr:EscN/YscN/HrcN family type III secretion system ATPase [Phycisphaerales bacterium]
AMLPRLLERAGRTQAGSITGIYTVLVEGDDIDEPLSDTVRGILDGHIWLSRRLANRGHYPAIDVLGSISRVAYDVTSSSQREAAQAVRAVLATWAEIEDLVSVGAYVPGANPDYDVAVQTREAINAFLRQSRDEKRPFADAVADLEQMAELIRRTRGAARQRGREAVK